MSLNRENICWPAPDEEIANGAEPFRIGFYAFDVIGEDYEWDIEYDWGSFWFVAEGASFKDCAKQFCRQNANPGAYNIFETRRAGCEQLDEMFKDALTKQKTAPRSFSQW